MPNPKIKSKINDSTACSYGCGNTARYLFANGNACCQHTHTQCPANRQKNSKKLAAKHKNDPNFNGLSGSGKMQGWETMTEDQQLHFRSMGFKQMQADIKSGKRKNNWLNRKHKKESIRKIAIAAAENTHGFKRHYGYSGVYDGMSFDSLGELAFYVYHKENRTKQLKRNTTITLDYDFEDGVHIFIPDFVDGNNQLYEIKYNMFPHPERNHAKIEQHSDTVIFLFHEDLLVCKNYCIEKYGKKYHEILYEKKEV